MWRFYGFLKGKMFNNNSRLSPSRLLSKSKPINYFALRQLTVMSVAAEKWN